ncbi:MAG: hypothetical protein LC745_09660, partial [Planctomycetia bacterium]|nr:hypothetical protein [Planctomycetia bacterium]
GAQGGGRSGHDRVVVVVAAIDARATVLASLSGFTAGVRGRGRVVLVDASKDGTAGEVARAFPEVRVIQRPVGSLAPELWRDGLRATIEPLVAFTTAAMVPAVGWLDAMLVRLDATGAAAVGGPIEPAGTLSPTDRAVYLLRYVNYLRPLDGPSDPEPPGDNSVYRRDRLRGLGHAIAEGFWEVEVHRHLRARGERLAMARGAVVAFHGGSRLVPTLAQRFRHARRYGAARSDGMTAPARLARAAVAPVVPALLLERIARALWCRGASFGPWVPAAPGLALLLAAWAAGEAKGTVAGTGRGPSRGGQVGHRGFGQVCISETKWPMTDD